MVGPDVRSLPACSGSGDRTLKYFVLDASGMDDLASVCSHTLRLVRPRESSGLATFSWEQYTGAYLSVSSALLVSSGGSPLFAGTLELGLVRKAPIASRKVVV